LRVALRGEWPPPANRRRHSNDGICRQACELRAVCGSANGESAGQDDRLRSGRIGNRGGGARPLPSTCRAQATGRRRRARSRRGLARTRARAERGKGDPLRARTLPTRTASASRRPPGEDASLGKSDDPTPHLMRPAQAYTRSPVRPRRALGGRGRTTPRVADPHSADRHSSRPADEPADALPARTWGREQREPCARAVSVRASASSGRSRACRRA